MLVLVLRLVLAFSSIDKSGVEGDTTEASKLVSRGVLWFRSYGDPRLVSPSQATSAGPRTFHMSWGNTRLHWCGSRLHIFIGNWTTLRACIHFDLTTVFPQETNLKLAFYSFSSMNGSIVTNASLILILHHIQTLEYQNRLHFA